MTSDIRCFPVCRCVLVLFLIALPKIGTAGNVDHSEAISLGEDAYRFSKKAYEAEEYDDAVSYARRAKNAADEARTAAEECGCLDAASFFDDAQTYSRRAQNSGDIDELRFHAKKAMRAAAEGIEMCEE